MTVYNDTLSDYITRLFARQDTPLLNVIASQDQHCLPMIQVRPEEGRFLQVLTAACNARKVVEIGTLGGYSGIWIARGLAPGGRLITVEKEVDHARIAMQNFAEAGVADRIEIRVGDAHDELQSLAAEAPFDLVFIDAEKTDYLDYLEWAIAHVRHGGTIAAHNAFRQGAIVDPTPDETAQLMREFNSRVAHDPRLCATIFPAGDGLLVAVKMLE